MYLIYNKIVMLFSKANGVYKRNYSCRMNTIEFEEIFQIRSCIEISV